MSIEYNNRGNYQLENGQVITPDDLEGEEKKEVEDLLKNKIVSSELLANKNELDVDSNNNGVVIKVPIATPDTVTSVIKIEVEGKMKN